MPAPPVFFSDSKPRAPEKSPYRPVFAFPGVKKVVLLTSWTQAREVLGDGNAGFLYNIFASDEGSRGVWAVPHPDDLDNNPWG